MREEVKKNIERDHNYSNQYEVESDLYANKKNMKKKKKLVPADYYDCVHLVD